MVLCCAVLSERSWTNVPTDSMHEVSCYMLCSNICIAGVEVEMMRSGQAEISQQSLHIGKA